MFRLAGLLLLLLLTYLLVAHAKVAPRNITRGEELSSCVDCRPERTLFNIIWGCVSTTIICAWAAIHPNIPPHEGAFKGAMRRLELMFWTIVAPEILPCWALNQRLAAMTIRDVYNQRKGYEMKKSGIWKEVKGWFSWYEIKEIASPEAWTVAHGHFLIMGGFRIVEPPDAVDTSPTSGLLVEETNTDTESTPEPGLEQGRETILTLEMLEKLVKDPEFKIQIAAAEITNRSKGDALSKTISILQSTWFILQCIGRRVQGLDLTHLELTTLALASLNGITFALWWDKPLGAQTVVRVYIKRKLTDAERQGRDSSFRSTIGPRVIAIRNIFLSHPEGWVQLLCAILLLLLSPILVFAFTFFATVTDLLGASNSFPPSKRHVPTFYVPVHRYSLWLHILLLITLGSIFGAIHCFGWNFPLPTHVQQKLWRVASVGVTVLPIASLPLALIFDSIIKRHPPTLSESMHNLTSILNFFICVVPYMIARFILLGLAIAHLRNLSPGAFTAINWAKYYPHIF